MGSTSPLKNKNHPRLRVILPIIFSVLLLFLPLGIHAVNAALLEEVPTVNRGEMDFEGHDNYAYHDFFLHGEVEFYYNQWIISEPNEPSYIYLPTPGSWSGATWKDGTRLDRSGYGSYRYVMHNLKPGTTLYVERNTDVPNRIYLNGILCSSAGNPNKEFQSPVYTMGENFDESIVVPGNGVVEYVMEVGNTGVGGARFLRTIATYSQEDFDYLPRAFTTVVVGMIFGIILLTTALFVIAQDRARHVFLSLSGLCALLLHLFSRDSLFLYNNLIISTQSMLALTGLFIALIAFFLILYAHLGRNRLFSRKEVVGLSASIAAGVAVFVALIGTGFAFLGVIPIIASLLYSYVKSMVATVKERPNLGFGILISLLIGYVILVLAVLYGAWSISLVYEPTVFTFVFAAMVLGIGFLDIYRVSTAKKDKAILERRYRLVANRALAMYASEQESLDMLSSIGNAYEENVHDGDHLLLQFSSSMRKRLIALRQEKISLQQECEIEDALFELRALSFKKEALFVLDVDEGKMNVPPLIFERPITEILTKIQKNEMVVLEEGKGVVSLLFPADIELSEATTNSFRERASIAGYEARIRPGMVALAEERKP